jgi:hypothetical protein
MTVGALKHLVEEDVKRGLGGKVRKYEFQISGTAIRPDHKTTLLNLTHYPARNSCLDVLREGEMDPVTTPHALQSTNTCSVSTSLEADFRVE